MPPDPPSSDTRESDVDPAPVFKTLRRNRGLTAAETAARMHISPSTYERFEAGDTRLNHDYIYRFAEVCGCDPHALFAAVIIHRPAFALLCADNQLATVITAGLQDLTDAVGEDLALLTTRDVVETVEPMFEALKRKVQDSKAARDRAAESLARLETNYRGPKT